MAEEQVILKLLGDASSAIRAVDSLVRRLGAGEKEVDQFTQSINQLSQIGKTMGAVFGGISAAGGLLIKSSTQIAARNEVLGLSLNVVGENAGYTRGQLALYEEGVKAAGITTSEARLALTRMAQGQLDLNKAVELARTGQNLAVIANKGSSESYGVLLQAVTGLQPRLLRQFGIVATLNQILGDLSDSTDAAAKRQRFMDFVLQEGARVAGVYEGAMELVGKRVTSLPRLFEEAKAVIGEVFLPVWGRVVDMTANLLKAFLALPEPVQKLIAIILGLVTAFAGVGAALGAFLVVLPFIVSGFAALSGLIPAVTGALSGLAAAAAPVLLPLLPVLAAIAAAVGAIVVIARILHKAWWEDWGGIRTAVVEAWAVIRPLIAQLERLMGAWVRRFGAQFGQLVAAFKELIGLKGRLEPFFTWLAKILEAIDWSSIFRTLTDTLNVVFGFISSWLTSIRNLLQGQGLASFRPLEKAAIDILTLVALVFEKFISKALTWGWNLIAEVANGMWRAAQSVIVRVMQAIGSLIGNFLAPAGSPPAEGPLANIVRWGRGVMDTYLRAFGLADFGLLRDALSPIGDILRSAVSAGDISEAESVQLFQELRQQAAGLIAHFRRTGEISEEMLGQIAESLGEGGEEYARFIRLQLEHQQALDNLRQIEEQVAEAREAGFIPAHLQAQLEAAEDQVAQTEEAVDWQREYLDAQQETVDLQQQLIDALTEVADRLGKLDEGGAGEAGAALAGISEAATDVQTGLSGLRVDIGQMSGEFLRMRARVVQWIEAVKAWLALPFEDKVQSLLVYLSQLTGIDIAGFVNDALTLIDEEGLVGVLSRVIEALLNYVATNWDGWAETIAVSILEMFAAFIEYIEGTEKERGDDFSAWFGRIAELFLAWIGAQILLWASEAAEHILAMFAQFIALLIQTVSQRAADLGRWFTRIMRGFFALLYGKLTQWARELRDWLGSLFAAFVRMARAKVGQWVRGLVDLGKVIVQTIKNGIASAWDLVSYLAGLLSDLASSLLQSDAWAGLLAVGGKVVEIIKQGISNKWGSFISWLLRKLNDIVNAFPFSEPRDPRSPLRNLSEAGEAIVANMQAGLDFRPMELQIARGLAGVQRAAMAGTNVTQNFGDVVFPNVRDGRDGLGVRRALDRDALRGSMVSRTRTGG